MQVASTEHKTSTRMGLLTHSESKTVIRVSSTNETKHFTSLWIMLKSNDYLQVQQNYNEMWIKIQQMQQYADIYSLQNYSTCSGCHSTHHQEY